MATTTAAISTLWTPPDPVTGLSATVVEEFSHVQLDWDISTLADIDFAYYNVRRRQQGASVWSTLANITGKAVLQYKDATGGQGVTYEYQVVVYKAIPGDVPLASENNSTATAALESDVWFVVGNENPEDEDHAFELPVIKEMHTRPIQQESFEPIVRNRKKVARGNVLGYEGSLTIQWTAEDRVAARVYLDFLANSAGPHLLKSPFGDVWRVEFDSPDYRYSVGGHLAVEIGWLEVN